MMNLRVRQMMDRLARSDLADPSTGWTPAVDIYETETEVVIVAEVSGVKREDMKVLVDGQIIRLYGARKPTCPSAGCRYHRMEIESGAFVRSFRITVPFLAEKVSAGFTDGFLQVTLPKDASPATRKIQVEQG